METGEVQLPPTAATAGPPALTPTLGHDRRRRTGNRRGAGRRWSWWRPALIGAVGLLVLVATVVVSIGNDHRLVRTNDSIKATRAELDRTAAEVTAARAHLAAAASQSAAAGTALAAASNQLTQVRAQVASAQAGVRLDGVSISELQTCLSGVDQVLNEISLGDAAGAAAILRQNSASCQAAEPSG